MQIHFHGTGGEAEAARLTSKLSGKAGNAAFLDIHYHGDQAMTAMNPAAVKGSAAFVDIHYHGDQAMTAVNPAAAKGSAALVDIHYHGDQAMGGLVRGGMVGESAQAEGGLMSSSSAVSNALRGSAAAATMAPSTGTIARPGGAQAFLDIHYHGASADEVTTPSLVKPGGSQAFLDIHYHGDQAAMGGLTAATLPGRGGQAAFLDIHYHGDQAALAGLMRETGAEGGLSNLTAMSPRVPSGGAPSIGAKPGSAAFIDIHYHGKTLADADVRGMPGLHIGNAALLDIHYHG
jgi:hypothetical protein